MTVQSTLKKHTAPDTRRQLHRQNPATLHIFSGIEGSFWVLFFHTGFCVKTCHQYFAFAAEPAPSPHQSNVDQVVWWLSGPAKKGAIRALGHPHTHLHQLCLGGEGRQRAENCFRRMAPFYAETGMLLYPVVPDPFFFSPFYSGSWLLSKICFHRKQSAKWSQRWKK